VSQSRTSTSEHFATFLDRDRLVARLQALVQTPSENPPGEELEAARLVAAYCEDLGGDVAMHEAVAGRPNVVAQWGSGAPTLAYCSHVDVVPAGDASLWAEHPYSGTVMDGRLYGRGSGDAKGPIAAALEAVEILLRSGFPFRGTLELELVADEETMGFKGAGHLVERGVVSPDIAIVGEPTSLRVVRAQRGACWFRLTTRGRAAHGSAPERGVSAIRHMAELVLRLEETLPDVEHPVLGGPTINVGTISGGAKVNIVPASCAIEVDRRTVPGETVESVRASIDEAIALTRARFPAIDAHVELLFNSNPFEVDVNSAVVQTVARSVAEATGSVPKIVGFRGASDARFLFEAGADVVLCGPGQIELAHTANESIQLVELERGAIAYALAFARLLSPE
jgi:succinyl-diaminopimelate desuccinylase